MSQRSHRIDPSKPGVRRNRVAEAIAQTERALASRDPLSTNVLSEALVLIPQERVAYLDWLATAHASGALSFEEAGMVARILGGVPGRDGWSPTASLSEKLVVTHFAVTFRKAPVHQIELAVPATPATMPYVRQAVRKLGAGIGLDPWSALALQVAVGEAVNLAIESATAGGGTISVRSLRAQDTLFIDVAGPAGGTSHGREPQPSRGLELMQALVDGVEVLPGTEMTLRLRVRLDRLPPPAAPDSPGATG